MLLVGHSWGSGLTMRVAASRPDLLHTLVGIGQVVDVKREEVKEVSIPVFFFEGKHDYTASF